MEVAITTKLLVYINYILLIYCGVELFQEQTIYEIKKQTAEMDQGRVTFLIVLAFIIGTMHICLMYQKIKVCKEKKREMELKNKITEYEFNNRKNSKDTI